MTTPSLQPLAAVVVSFVAAGLILVSGRRPNLREAWTLLASFSMFGLVASMVPGVLAGETYVTNLGTIVPGIDFVLRADPLGVLFASLASLLWIVTSFYSIGYMRGLDEDNQTRYFASFAVSVAAAVGIAFSGNLLTIFVFYEVLSVATYPLVAHDETPEARSAGRKYLAYTFFGGGVLVLAGTTLVYWLAGTVDFTPGGIAALANADPTAATLAFIVLALGFGVKAGLMPLHQWLPEAMVAPTPVSGLLHAVAVVKSGVFGIARVVLDVFGPETLAALGPDRFGDLGIALPLAALAAITLTVASIIALRKDHLKRRLAYSTISQLSYIVLGLALLEGDALIGGLLHIPAHAFMKLTLFFCAGIIHVETHTDYISEMAGIGKRMPLTMLAFGVAAAGMAGIPLVAGFVSKWYIVIGAFEGGNGIFAAVLLLSGILNIAYFWPIVYQAFFETPDDTDEKPLVEGPYGGRDRVVADGGDATNTADDAHDASDEHNSDHEDHHHGGPPAGGWEVSNWRGGESTWFMLGPILTAAALSLLLGVIPHTVVFLRIVETIVGNLPGVMG
ncbi:proton-conducting transporter transmembrane domain-containing protein [Halonotius roseus]|uniref:Monovalent cation/H+ antiporter subunit D family protein n=1 Tax=Halonotius roseus TaxID=2511997 RepID=A0A544QQP6_9EURY|nr:proton-conducting transporter membrane subunit [Halonotius roseus]TQQ81756.1 monovalent cation/H+ antiporter subunit D family protein [Halonotius roseus]